MSRRRAADKRQVLPDPIYNSVVLNKFINEVMVGGKKTVAQKIVYGALDIIKTNKNAFVEYSNKKELINIIQSFKKIKKGKNYSKYLLYTPKKVMNTFNDVFLKKSNKTNLDLFDYSINSFISDISLGITLQSLLHVGQTVERRSGKHNRQSFSLPLCVAFHVQ